MEFSLPTDFAERMKALLGDEYDTFEKAFTESENAVGIRFNTLKANAKDKVCAKLGGFNPVPWCENGTYGEKTVLSGKHPYHAAGLFYFQEPSAMAVVPQLKIKPGDRVLDLCAAPGGKSTQAAELCGEGILMANEIVTSRAKILADNIERMGVKNAVVTNESPEKLAKKYPEFFDCIILDAPCSGEGMFRKEPQALTEWSAAHSDSCAERQKHIADSAVKMLAPGGRLVYSTCTFSRCENEDVAEYITDTYPDIHLIPIKADGLSKGFDKDGFTARILPHKARGEGHFIALFERDGERADLSFEKSKSTPPKEYLEFAKSTLKSIPEGEYVTFGDRLYLMPEALDIKNIRVLRAGLELGEIRKGRFIPSHALALALSKDDFINTVSFDADSDEIKHFMHGETLSADINGWCAVLADGYPIGWAKGSGGILKNHYPKHLRTLNL